MGKMYYELEVELAGSKPRIWRRFCLRTSATFEALHAAIQDAFEWSGHHLYEFSEAGRSGETLCGHEALDDEGVEVASSVKLKGFFGEADALKNKACVYMYDFGDGWEHKVKLKRVVELDEVFTRRMTGGGAPGAIDDCGGVWGYQQLLEEAVRGDKEAQAQLASRPAEFVLAEVKAGFDIPKQARPLAPEQVAPPKERQAKAAGALPAAEVVEEVARLLLEQLRADADLARVIALASARWAALVKRELPKKKPTLWAAALEYAATRELREGRRQGVIAAAYGVSGPAVSLAWPQIAELLEAPARRS